MRILLTFAGGSGHLEPLVPIARAARAAGHTVAFVGRPWMVPKAEALGFETFSAGADAGLTPVRRPLAALDVAREMRDLGNGFGRRIARERAADILPLCAAWQPDLLVCEEVDFGAMVAAERLGIPHATVLVIAAGGFVRPEFVAAPLNDVRAEHGLPPDLDLAMVSRHLVLSPFPPSLRDPAFPLPPTAYPFRSANPWPTDGPPPWVDALGDAPLVYFTLGTVFPLESGDLFQRVIAGLRDLPINLLVTVGRDFDPAELGPPPANVRVERYIPQAQVLPACRLVICHGGSGSLMGALSHGLPLVLIPMGADQPLNAERCEAVGVGLALDPLALTPQTVREMVLEALENPAYRQAAVRMAAEIAALPTADSTIPRLERLAQAT
ncbi:MAG: glycosyltransferase [Anaerolineae bacterium]